MFSDLRKSSSFGLGDLVELLDLHPAQDGTGEAVGQGILESRGIPLRGQFPPPKVTDCLQKIGNGLRAIDGMDAEGIAGKVVDTAVLEAEFEMAGLLIGAFRHQVIDEELNDRGFPWRVRRANGSYRIDKM